MTNMFIVASAKQLQKSTRGFPLAFIRLSITPINTENTTKPRMLVEPVVELPGSQTLAVTSVKNANVYTFNDCGTTLFYFHIIVRSMYLIYIIGVIGADIR